MVRCLDIFEHRCRIPKVFVQKAVRMTYFEIWYRLLVEEHVFNVAWVVLPLHIYLMLVTTKSIQFRATSQTTNHIIMTQGSWLKRKVYRLFCCDLKYSAI